MLPQKVPGAPELAPSGNGDGANGADGLAAVTLSSSVPDEVSSPGEKPTIHRAKVQYAKVNKMAVDEVTEAMLHESPEGIEGWACHGLDCKARGPMGNAMYRQLKKDVQAQECYKWLFDDLKKKFRQAWAMERSFDVVIRKRIKILTTTVKQEEIGAWKNELQLQQHYGGVDQPEAKRQADNYIRNCRKFKDWTSVTALLNSMSV